MLIALVATVASTGINPAGLRGRGRCDLIDLVDLIDSGSFLPGCAKVGGYGLSGKNETEDAFASIWVYYGLMFCLYYGLV